MRILGFIPARAGSKRISGKNIMPLAGKPLLAHTIEAAKKSKYINRVLVSTDSENIAKIAEQYGAEVPFLRPEEISRTDSTEMQFFEHALGWLVKNENYVPDLIVLLYPTSPFRKPETIDRAIEKIFEYPDADSLRSVRLCSEHPHKMWVIDNNLLKPLIKSEKSSDHTLSYQSLPKVYIQNASIYITKPRTIREMKSPIGNIVIPFIMDEMESIDINNPIDFKIAEMVAKDMKIKR
jgi:CMP-N-acetylneuraminic acid synthetase